MAEMRALILAAGRGSRMGDASQQVPKCLLEVGRRRLIEHQLDTLAECGIGPAAITVGYGADEIREVVGQRAAYIQNARWQTTNSLYSFSLGQNWSQGNLMVINCDVLFSRRVIEKLLDTEGDAIAVDSASGHGREQMKVAVERGLVRRMSKDLPEDESAGENLGILKLTSATAQQLFQQAGQLLKAGHENDWLGSAVNDLAAYTPLKAVDMKGLPWVEIDFPVDLDRARREVWPQIRKFDHPHRRMWQGLRWAAGLLLLTLAIAIGPLVSRLSPTPSIDWDSIPLAGLASTQIALDDRNQGWWVLQSGKQAHVHVAGGQARVETRLLNQGGERVSYVLEVQIEELPTAYYSFTTRPSGKATHPEWLISHKERVVIDIPDHGRQLSIRLLAPEETDCLLRVRQPDLTGDD